MDGDDTGHGDVTRAKVDSPPPDPDDDDDPDDPLKSTPLTRYNAMLAIVKNTLYMCVPWSGRGEALMTDIDRYGGIFETANPAREYTLDDFVTLNLEKLDRFVHLRGTGLDELEWRGSDDEEGGSSDSEDGGEDDSDDEDEGVDEELEALEEGEEDEEARERRFAALSQAEKVSPILQLQLQLHILTTACIDKNRKRCVNLPTSSWASQRTQLDPRKMC